VTVAQVSAADEARVIPVRNVWYMLLYAWDLAQFRDQVQMVPEDSPELLDLLARVLVSVTRGLLRRGLYRDYRDSSRPLR